MSLKITSKRRWYRGITAVETAVVFPILVLLTLGAIEYGWMFLKAHQMTNAARNAVRVAVLPNANNGQVATVISDLMTSAQISGYNVTITPGDVTSVDTGDTIKVNLSVPWENVAIMNIPLLPKPANIKASVTMAKEGP